MLSAGIEKGRGGLIEGADFTSENGGDLLWSALALKDTHCY